MSRFRRAAHGVASGYLLLAVTALYALVSLPIALHFLSAERFGIWTLMSSYAGYFNLVDLGMSASIARLLVDHKDRPAGGTYGRLIKTGWLVLCVQGAIIVLAGLFIAPLLSRLLMISSALERDFVGLLRWYCFGLAITYVGRIPMNILMAHQRIAIVNYIQVGQMMLNLGFQWLGFWLGQDVYSIVWGAVLSGICGQLVYLAFALRLHLFPPAGTWGWVSWTEFKEIFGYGKDMFLMALGGQLIWASQSSIITRQLGLAASTAWYAGTRAFNLVNQAIWRIYDSASPAFSEMIARGETARLRERYKSMVILTASISGFAAVSFAVCNSSFVTVWTHGKITWPPINDVLLGLLMILMAVQHCHTCFIGLTKKIRFMRWIYGIEGIAFVSGALLVAGPYGLTGIIVCSVVCITLFTGAYSVWRISRHFELTTFEAGLRWVLPMMRGLALFIPVALTGWWAFGRLENPVVRMGLGVLLCGSLGPYLLVRFGLSEALQRELLQRAPRRFSPALRWVLASAVQG